MNSPPHRIENGSATARRALVMACAFAGGVAAARHGLASLWPTLSAPLVITGLHVWRDSRGRATPRPTGTARILLQVTFAGLLGAGCAALHARLSPAAHLLDAWQRHGFVADETVVRLRGRLVDLEWYPETGRCVLILALHSFVLPGQPPLGGSAPAGVRVRLGVPAAGPSPPAAWEPGARLEVSARLGPPIGFRNPGAFDRRSYLEARGISLVGRVKSARLVRVLEPAGLHAGLLVRARHRIVERLCMACTPRETAAFAFMAAVLMGQREHLPASAQETLRRAGAFHVVALSGLHIGFILSLITVLLLALPLPPSARRLAACAALLIYWGLARDSGSLGRAILMAILVMGGSIAGRAVSTVGAAAVVAILMLATNPAWIDDAGFHLTFAATLGILVTLRPGSTDRAPPAGRRGGMLPVRILGPSSGAVLGTAAIAAHHFHQMTPVSLLSNLIAVPVTAASLCLGLLIACIQRPVPRLAGALCTLDGWLIRLLLATAERLAATDLLSFTVLPPPAALVLGAGSALLAAYFVGRRARRRALVLCLLLTCMCALRRTTPADGTLQVTALDVGQGDALFVLLPEGTTLLIDAGGSWPGGFDLGEQVVGPALRALGHGRIDILAVTHAHRDHLGGAAAILRQFRPYALWLGRMDERQPLVAALIEQARRQGTAVLSPRAGVRLLVGGARLDVLNPSYAPQVPDGSVNDDSLVLRLALGRQAAILTGDLEAAGERDLIAHARSLRAGLLKVGHHGSATSTMPRFLAAIEPHQALISVGRLNPWGHPSEQVEARLSSIGANIHRTDRDGAVRFVTDGLSAWRSEVLVTHEPQRPIR